MKILKAIPVILLTLGLSACNVTINSDGNTIIIPVDVDVDPNQGNGSSDGNSGNQGGNAGEGEGQSGEGEGQGSGSQEGGSGEGQGSGSQSGDSGEGQGSEGQSGEGQGSGSGEGQGSGDSGTGSGSGEGQGSGSQSGDSGEGQGSGSQSGESGEGQGSGSQSGDSGEGQGSSSGEGQSGEGQQGQGSEPEGGDNEPQISENHGLVESDPLTGEEAVALMEETGDSKIVGGDTVYYVKGIFDDGTIYNSNYKQWSGGFVGSAFEVVSAVNTSSYSPETKNGELDGFEVIVSGYLELYKGKYQMGYLPANVSPTNKKFNPSIIDIKVQEDEPVLPGDGDDTGDDEPTTTIEVSSVTLNKSSSSLEVGQSETLKATVSPNNATNKTVSWSTSNSEVASVTQLGVVKALKAGNATITAKAGNKTATCTFTVTAAVTPVTSVETYELVDDVNDLTEGDKIVIVSESKYKVAGNLSNTVLSPVDVSFNSHKIEKLPDDAMEFTLGKNNSYWTLTNEDGKLLGATAVKKLALDNGSTEWSISISSDGAVIENSDDSYGTILYNSSSPRFTTYTSSTSTSMLLPQIYKGGSSEPVYPTAISITGNNEVSVGKTTQLKASFTPSNTNQKTVTWTSSDTSVATISSSGLVKGLKVGDTVITATGKDANGLDVKGTLNISVREVVKAKYTIMVYICGSNLESDSGLATKNINEMLSVDYPSDVNVIMQTGGATKWKTSGISAKNIGRFHIENGSLVSDAQLSQANMGSSDTFKSFIEWGTSEYPAEKTGVIMWNHGGAMDGCCFDDNYSDGDPLTNAEMKTALQAALGSNNKLEWIGYDCCLMAVQDIAEFNSHYFNYMVSSQEAEPGEGWDYDAWLKKIAQNSSITSEELLPQICDSYVTKCANCYASYGAGNYNDATLSVLDLTKMETYRTAWEAMASDLSSKFNSKSNWTTFTSSVLNEGQRFGYYNATYGYAYDIYDVDDFLNKVISTSAYSAAKNNAQLALDAFEDLVIYNKFGKDRLISDTEYTQTNDNAACGLCFVAATSGINSKSMYSTSQTNFANWQQIVYNYGSWYN